MTITHTHYSNTANHRAACDGYTRHVPPSEPHTIYRAAVTCPDCRELLESPTPTEIQAAIASDTCVRCGRLHWQSTIGRSDQDYLTDGTCGDCAAGQAR